VLGGGRLGDPELVGDEHDADAVIHEVAVALRAYINAAPASQTIDRRQVMPESMSSHDVDELLGQTRDLALRYIRSLPERPVAETATRETLMASLGASLADEPVPPGDVIRELADGADDGLVATSSGRFFGFVNGGVLPAALAADWLTSTWDQNPGFYTLSPAAAVVEEVTAEWIRELLSLPSHSSVGFTTGAQMAIVAGLAAARHHLFHAAGWDVEGDGLIGAPPIRVIVGRERHATIGRALRLLGLGERKVVEVAADDQGRMSPRALEDALKSADVPTIVCAQAGNVNTGSFDPLAEICEATHEHGGWVQVDGAFGLWAAASPRLAHLVKGIELCDSWATDGHKTLNVPYDSGLVACAHPESHSAAMALRAPYLIRNAGERAGSDWTPESSRRGRAFVLWAALRSLGRKGVAEMVESLFDNARRFAARLEELDEVSVLNEVVFNQVLIRVADDDERTREVGRLVRADGAAWLADSLWRDTVVLRISVCDYATSNDDVDRSVDAILDAVRSTA
jgi:glutamate/tyrosine decarboxylase-like PLP-dependent enzyme